jgi:hypothetical protein
MLAPDRVNTQLFRTVSSVHRIKLSLGDRDLTAEPLDEHGQRDGGDALLLF